MLLPPLRVTAPRTDRPEDDVEEATEPEEVEEEDDDEEDDEEDQTTTSHEAQLGDDVTQRIKYLLHIAFIQPF